MRAELTKSLVTQLPAGARLATIPAVSGIELGVDARAIAERLALAAFALARDADLSDAAGLATIPAVLGVGLGIDAEIVAGFLALGTVELALT